MKVIGFSFLFILVMVTIAAPPLALFTVPTILVVLGRRRSVNRRVDFHRERYERNQVAMKIAKACR